MPVEGIVVVVVNGRNLVSSLDEIKVVAVVVDKSRWLRLMVVVVGKEHRWIYVDVAGGCV